MVYDFDGDGKAELAVKTADGTVDGVGNVISDPPPITGIQADMFLPGRST